MLAEMLNMSQCFHFNSPSLFTQLQNIRSICYTAIYFLHQKLQDTSKQCVKAPQYDMLSFETRQMLRGKLI
jgi:hypothetical protein